jgi:hypothetical protein
MKKVGMTGRTELGSGARIADNGAVCITFLSLNDEGLNLSTIFTKMMVTVHEGSRPNPWISWP